MLKIRPIIVIVSLLLIYSCSKSSSSNPTPTPTPTPKAYYSFINASDSDLTVNVYANENDYINSTNVVFTTTIKPGWNRDSTDKLTVGKNYLMDCYSKGYTITNWTWYLFTDSGAPSTVHFVPTTMLGATGHIIFNETNGAIRKLVLNYTQSQTNWQLVDIYKNISSTWTSVWSTATVNQKALSMVLQKNFHASLTDSSGTKQYFFDGSDNGYGFTMDMMNTNDTSYFGEMFNGGPSAFKPPYTRSYDSLGFRYGSDNSTVYVFVKQ